MNLTFGPSWAFGICVATVACWAGLALLLVRIRPQRPLWPVLFWYTLTGLAWSAGALGVAFYTNDPDDHWQWLVVQYTGVLIGPPLWWSLMLRFAQQRARRPEWATPVVEFAPLFLAGFCWLVLVTNPYHGGFIEPVWNGRNQYRLIWYVQAASGYLCLVGALVLTVWLRRASIQSVSSRAQLDTLLLASLAAIVVNGLYVSRLWSPQFDPTVVAFGFGLALVFAGMFRNRLFAISGLTSDHLLRQESDGAAVLDGDGKLVLSNPAAAQLAGVEVLTPDVDFVELLSRRLELEADESLVDILTARDQPEQGHLFRVRPSDGQCRWMRVQSTRIPGRWPSRGGLGIRLRDETKLHEAIERAAQQAASIEAILGSINDGLFVVDAFGRLVYANERFWAMWELSRVVPARIDERGLVDALVAKVKKEDAEAVLALARDTESTSEAVDVTLKSGDVLTLATAPLVRSENVVGRVWTFRDVTERARAEQERRQLEERMRESQKLESLGVLAGGIAHDFNNILVGILGSVDLAIDGIDRRGSVNHHLTRVKKSADRAAELVQQLLAYAGRGQVPSETVNLSRLVLETRELLRSTISKKAKLKLDLTPDVFVEGDPVQLRQIVMNVLTNASDALGDEEGTIRIDTGVRRVTETEVKDALPRQRVDENDFAFVEISDSGCGMDADTMSRIFEPFFSTKFTGRGLGLSAALGIVRRHHGFIKVRSAPAEGTTFLLLLPVVARPAKRRSRRAMPHPLPMPLGTILVVDDEEPVRAVARSALELEGFHVIEAEDGHEGLRRFRAHTSDVGAILLDMTMPGMDGAETLFAIRQISRDIPVILSSGYSEKDTMSRCEGLVGTSFIQKPYTAQALIAAIREAMAVAVDAPHD
jgi:signal transduction histidine kinase/ActR/RegA family two-component response regulator